MGSYQTRTEGKWGFAQLVPDWQETQTRAIRKTSTGLWEGGRETAKLIIRHCSLMAQM